ncbi:hypothetical protein [Agarivorans gilvus]|uniref:Uncharacterized protein n=1 Tax=Agarivorans gilvus TaxID=680279 RepID=A0ABQ1HU59_9ALTE|nr:hypothetical protein [Agarivorans gilvus]GGA91752.1 hypothetical protein GCM10007414_00470 [Agarivorans gilvus]
MPIRKNIRPASEGVIGLAAKRLKTFLTDDEFAATKILLEEGKLRFVCNENIQEKIAKSFSEEKE